MNFNILEFHLECSRVHYLQRHLLAGGEFICVQKLKEPECLKPKRCMYVWMDQDVAGDSGRAQTVE